MQLALPRRGVASTWSYAPLDVAKCCGIRAIAASMPRMRVPALTCCAIFLLSACEGGDAAPPQQGGDDAAISRADAGRVDAGLDAGTDAGTDASVTPDAARESGAGPTPASDSGGAQQQADTGVSPPRDAGPSDAAIACATPEEQKFSFFMISYAAIQRESGSADGFGGNLGGISGADAICQRVAERSSACQKGRVWRAFLSTTKEHAIDRIGKGPWHDRLGRIVAANLTDLAQERPAGAHPQIINDLPNEDGVPNRNPDGTGNVDNHQTLTGSGVDGKLYQQGPDAGRFSACGPNGETWSVEKATCWDWTSAEPAGCPHVGHSWPRQGSGLHWISVGNEGGCAPGAVLADRGGHDGTRRVGSAGGYGGFYCFAVTTP
jgi:hypothetical protein